MQARTTLQAAFLIAILTLVGCQGGGGIAPDRPVHDPASLSVLCWNIRYGTADDGPNSWHLRAQRAADVVIGPGGTPDDPAWELVGLQEALRFQIDQFLTAAPAYAYVGAGRDDGQDAGEHCGVLYRPDRLQLAESGEFWLSDTPDEPGSKTWGNEITRMCAWARFVPIGSRDGRGFYVFNTHWDHRSEASRREAAELIAFKIGNRAHPDEPVIFMGDFNAAPESPERLYLTGQASDANGDGVAPPIALTDALLDTGYSIRRLGTFNGWRAGIDHGPSIDTIFVSDGLRIVDSGIEIGLGVSGDNRPPSDHHPISAELKIESP
ncbi:MAG: endonuclease/exonuclease/phosphatase family protein [Planctomycetota bacterium]